jgi:rare lipoprotein A
MPAAGFASTGGSGLGAGSTGTSSPTSAPGVSVQPANQSVQAAGNGISIVTRASALLRDPLRFSGSVSRTDAGETVEVERRGRETGWTWAPTTHGTVQRSGAFTAVWPVNHIGRFAVRAVLEPGGAGASRAAPASPALTITVYRPSIATQYGPGFFGQKTACGQVLRTATLGVANRTLKCGTRVAIMWHGRSIIVPVIDRGPYANHADWDLTTATAQALGISGTATVGAVSLPSR